ncbi:hypothetical protein JCM5353_000835 [Sporobolomyces roseus]
MQPTWVNQYPTPSEAAKNSLKPTQKRSAPQQQFPPQVAGVRPPVYNGQQNGFPPGIPVQLPPPIDSRIPLVYLPTQPMNPFNQTQPLPFPSHGQPQPFLAPPPPPPFHPIYNPLPFDPSLSLPSSSPHPSSISTPLSYETSNHPFSRMDPSPVSTPPPPPHPPGSHSTQLTIAMSQKHASEVLALHSKEKARSKSATTESAVDDKTLLSRFAPTYTPLWLKQVNACYPSLVIPLSASPDSSNFQYSLIAEIYPPKLLKQLLALEQSTTSRIKTQLSSTLPKLSQSLLTSPEPKSLSLHPLSPATYAAHFLPLHLLEYSARSLELHKSSLYNVPLKPYTATSLSSSSNLNLYALPTPFIRESWPPIAMGDTCFIRPLVDNDKWWKGVEVEARVWAIDRIRGEVILNVEKKAIECLTANGTEASKLEEEGNGVVGEEEERGFVSVNLIWKIQDRLFEDWKKATEIIDLHLNQSLTSSAPNSQLASRPLSTAASSTSNNSTTTKTPRKRFPVESWLFPTQEDLAKEETGDTDTVSLQGRRWVDPKLNEEQRNAVQSILWARHRAPFLVSGPPGTGKTSTIVEAVFQILKEHPRAHVLVCGASNPSTDTLALRLRSLMPSQLLRLNHPNRPFNEVRRELLPFCHVDGEVFGTPDVQTLLSKRVICTTVLDCSILLESRLTNSNLSTLERHLSERLHPEMRRTTLETPHFDYLLIDEAAQATESDLLPALAVVATDTSVCSPAHITICGDSQQLSPHIVSPLARDHDLDVSLLERLLRLPLYADHPYARRSRRRNPEVKWEIETTPFVDLVRNYRSVEEILWLPSTLFYHETLLPFASSTIQQTPLRSWSGLPNPSFPLLFHHSAGEDFEVEEGSSFYNPSEINLVVQYIQDLVKDGEERGHGKVRAKEISVISPFREQVWRIRLRLRKLGLGDVDVGNVEALQGAENRIVILSPVRSINVRWIEHDRLTNRGLIREPKRFNVAMTRAKELLIVTGNAQTLTLDSYWRAFYQLCVRNKCYVGPPVTSDGDEDLVASAQAVSRMEMEYRARKDETNETSRGEGGDENGRKELEVTVGRMVSMLDEGED